MAAFERERERKWLQGHSIVRGTLACTCEGHMRVHVGFWCCSEEAPCGTLCAQWVQRQGIWEAPHHMRTTTGPRPPPHLDAGRLWVALYLIICHSRRAPQHGLVVHPHHAFCPAAPQQHAPVSTLALGKACQQHHKVNAPLHAGTTPPAKCAASPACWTWNTWNKKKYMSI